MPEFEWLSEFTLQVKTPGEVKTFDKPSREVIAALEMFGDTVPDNPYAPPKDQVIFYAVLEQTDEYRSVEKSYWWSKEDADRAASKGKGWYGAPHTVSRKVFTINGTPPIYAKEGK